MWNVADSPTISRAGQGSRSRLIRVSGANNDDLMGAVRVRADAARPTATTSSLERAISDPEGEVMVVTMGRTAVWWAKTHQWDHSDGPAAAGHYLRGVTVAPSFS